MVSTNNLVNLAYMTSVGLGGAFLTKTMANLCIWCWNRYAKANHRISQQMQERVVKTCEIIGGLLFAALAARLVFSENSLLKQIKHLKEDLRNQEKEINDLFKAIYNQGKNAIDHFKLGGA